MYEETHALNHTNVRLKGDKTVNALLDNAVTRESQYVTQRSSVVESQEVLDKAMRMSCVEGELPTFLGEVWDKVHAKTFSDIKSSVKEITFGNTSDKHTTHLKNVYKQGEFLKLAQRK